MGIYQKITYDFLYSEHIIKYKSIKTISTELKCDEHHLRSRLNSLNIKEDVRCSECGTRENLRITTIRGKIVKCNICSTCYDYKKKKPRNTLDLSYDKLYKLHIGDELSVVDISKLYDISVNKVISLFNYFKLDIVKRCQHCKTTENLVTYLRKTGTISISNICTTCRSLISQECRANETEEQKRSRKLKSEKVSLERYGVTNIWKDTTYIKQKTKEKLGEDNVRKTEQFKVNARKTKKEKYGNEFYNNRPKAEETCLKNNDTPYGFIGSGKSYSKISQKLFWKIYNRLPLELQEKCYFAELNKEFHMHNSTNNTNYFYDFVISNIKLIIEFNGNAWHYHPLKWKGHPFKKEKEEVTLKDETKINYAIDKDFYTLVVWEHEYKSSPQFIESVLVKTILNHFKEVK
jgi:hypothetical protein